MSGADNLTLPPGETGTLLFDASGGVTSLAGYGGAINGDAINQGAINRAPTVLAVSRTHVSSRHGGHPASRTHGHQTRHHLGHHATHGWTHTLHLSGEQQPF